MLVTKFLQWQWAEIWISLHIGLSRTRAPKSWAQLGVMNNIHCVCIFHIYYIVTAMWLLVHFLVPLLFYFFLKWSVMIWPKQLSHYLFSFPFSFLLTRKSVDTWNETTKRDVWEFINRSKHRKYISSVPQLNGNSIEFSLSTQTRSSSKMSQSKSLHEGSLSQTSFGP